jgi:hypothetical protein
MVALVAKHLLNDLHIGAGRDGQARGRVAQFVRVESRESSTLRPFVSVRRAGMSETA